MNYEEARKLWLAGEMSGMEFIRTILMVMEDAEEAVTKIKEVVVSELEIR